VREAAARVAAQLLGPEAEGLAELSEDARRAVVEGLAAGLAVRGRLAPGGASAARPAPAPEPGLEDVRRVLRASLSGLSPAALGRELGRPAEALADPLDGWVRAGAVVRRGGKLFLP